ncbi:Uncharacterised protein [Salmonella enterica]|uniref:Uncharacterized protein n=1 Tax=Salmonella enterica I TaxID=59201 RepID=A0A3S5DCM7_SALET|nr:Uncharacterised protein [Salmonella enterica]VEA33679.1 Uncharacterised protein [Salmonella enterica subsp. enterica]
MLTLNASIATQVKLWIYLYCFDCTSEAFVMQFFQASLALILNASTAV